MNEGRVMTVQDLAKQWQVKESWIYQHMHTLPHFKIGSLVRFDPRQLEQWLDSGAYNPLAKSKDIRSSTPLAAAPNIVRFPFIAESRVAVDGR
jgi:hypothetical protein